MESRAAEPGDCDHGQATAERRTLGGDRAFAADVDPQSQGGPPPARRPQGPRRLHNGPSLSNGLQQLAGVLKEWREPSFDVFSDRTAWALLNAFTTVLTSRSVTQPQSFVASTMRLHHLLEASLVPQAQGV